jgi:hypothetical protein
MDRGALHGVEQGVLSRVLNKTEDLPKQGPPLIGTKSGCLHNQGVGMPGYGSGRERGRWGANLATCWLF